MLIDLNTKMEIEIRSVEALKELANEIASKNNEDTPDTLYQCTKIIVDNLDKEIAMNLLEAILKNKDSNIFEISEIKAIIQLYLTPLFL